MNKETKKIAIPMKRISMSVHAKKTPEKVFRGQAIAHDISGKHIAFFTTQKIPIDEELILAFHYNGQEQKHEVVMKQIQEQISSGRVMNTIPSETNPFPARKFYLCYTWPAAAIAAAAATTTDTAVVADTAAAVPAATDAAPAEATPVAAATGDAAPAAVAAPVSDIPVAVVDAAPAVDITAAAPAEPAPEQKAA